MAVIEIAKIQIRRGQELQTGIPQLDSGEFGWAEDTENLYIGKRIVDGAVDDNNTRILTENDLANIFAYLSSGGTIASTSTYKYRENDSHIHAVTSTIARKLDDRVSLTDYGVVPAYTATDISDILELAVNDLFLNQAADPTDWRRGDARRELTIPAGNYYINRAIDLPPYTTLVGEGPGITTLKLTSTNSPMFRTVDANGFGGYVDGVNLLGLTGMDSGSDRARNVTIANMTLELENTSTQAIVSLDNVLDARVERVNFTTKKFTEQQYYTVRENMLAEYGISGINLVVFDPSAYPEIDNLDLSEENWFVIAEAYSSVEENIAANHYGQLVSTTSSGGYRYFTVSTPDNSLIDYQDNVETFSLVKFNGHGKGVALRGTGGGIEDTSNLCVGAKIIDCRFDNLAVGIQGTGTVVRFTAEKNVFKNLIKGITSYTIDTDNGPVNGTFIDNRFEDIVQEGIYIGSNPYNDHRSNHSSSDNYFVRVGNGLHNSDYINTSAYPVISLLSPGSKTTNDYFHRRTVASTASNTLQLGDNPTFYYNPLIKGKTTIVDGSVTTATLWKSDNLNPDLRKQGLTYLGVIGVTGEDQMYTIRYQMTCPSLSRKGEVIVNIAPDGYSAVTDTYNYIENLFTYSTTTNTLTADTALSSEDVLIIARNPSSPIAGLDDLANLSPAITPTNSTFFITGSNQYAGYSAVLESISIADPTMYVITTQSAYPQFDYASSATEVYTVLQSDSPQVEWQAESEWADSNKFVVLMCNNESKINDITLEYQINILN